MEPEGRALDQADEAAIAAMRHLAAITPKPTAQQRILGALAVTIEGDAAPAQAVLWLTWPVVARPSSATLRGLASRVLRAAARASLGRLHPDEIAPIAQAVEAALDGWPPRFEKLDGGSHWRPL